MNLFKISDFEPDYRKSFEDAYILGFEVLTVQQERVGRVVDMLMDDIGQLYYLVIDIGSWFSHKLVLVVPEQFRIDRQQQQIHLIKLDKKQVHSLPTCDSAFDSTRSENRPPETANQSSYPVTSIDSVLPVEASAPLETSMPLEAARLHSERTMQTDNDQKLEPVPVPEKTLQQRALSENPEKPTPLQPESNLDVISEEIIPLFEERLIISQKKRKIGEVIFRKQIETRIIEVPVRRERLIIEQVSPELKQLAIVDLPSEQLSDIELAEIASSVLETAKADEFIDIATANQILSKIAKGSSHSVPKVKLVFEDARLQTAYQQYIHKTLTP